MRIAEDEALLVGADEVTVADPHAIIAREHGYCGVSMPRDEFDDWFSQHAPWRLPPGEPAFGQGAVAGLPIKVWADRDRALVITRTSLRHVLEERL